MSTTSVDRVARDALIHAAHDARQRAYAPYSGYTVGAALLTVSSRIVTGCNVENASYPASICAERVALTKAVSEGERDFVALAVATSNGGAPCGICRQVLNEFAPDLLIFIADEQGNVEETTLDALLPSAFGPNDLR
jgi:cytidine deaminase